MSGYYGWGDHVPETAKVVAKAFCEGRACKRGNCWTDGEYYWLKGCGIARRVPEQERAANVLNILLGGARRPLLQLNIHGWPTKMTARHLTALGVRAECRGIKNPVFMINGKVIKPSTWYSLDEIEALPAPTPPAPVLARKPRASYVDLNLSLF